MRLDVTLLHLAENKEYTRPNTQGLGGIYFDMILPSKYV
jgi:hypothetical protein